MRSVSSSLRTNKLHCSRNAMFLFSTLDIVAVELNTFIKPAVLVDAPTN